MSVASVCTSVFVANHTKAHLPPRVVRRRFAQTAESPNPDLKEEEWQAFGLEAATLLPSMNETGEAEAFREISLPTSCWKLARATPATMKW